MAAVYPWEAIRREYIEGRRDVRGGVVYPAYEDLARKYTCSLSTIAQRGAREGWPTQRRAFQEQIIEQESVVAPLTAASLSLDQAAVATAARGIACIDTLFQRFGAQIADKTLTQREVFDKFIDLEKLSRALRTFQDVGQSRVVGKGGEVDAL